MLKMLNLPIEETFPVFLYKNELTSTTMVVTIQLALATCGGLPHCLWNVSYQPEAGTAFHVQQLEVVARAEHLSSYGTVSRASPRGKELAHITVLDVQL